MSECERGRGRESEREREREREERDTERKKRNDDFPQKETTPGIVSCPLLGDPPILQGDAAAGSDRSGTGNGNGCALMEVTCA